MSRDPEALTRTLRASADPQWVRVRELLAERGVDPMRAVLAYDEAEAPFLDVGVVVTPGGGVFHFAFDWLNRDVSRGRFAEWEDLSGRWERTPHRRAVELARGLAAREGSGPG